MANGTKTKQEGIFVKPIPSVNWNYMNNANDQQIYTQNLNRLKKSQDNLTALQQAESRNTANLYGKFYGQLNSFQEIGDASYENNMKEFFGKKVDDYNAINNAIDKGIIDPKQGAAALSRINQMVLDYKRLAPQVLAQALYMQENGSSGNNTLSKLNDPNLSVLFDKLLNGSGDVNVGEYNGGLYLMGKGVIPGTGSNKEQPWEYNLNLNEFEKIVSREDSIAMTVPTNKEAGIEEIFKIFSPATLNSVAMPTELTLSQRNNPKSKRAADVDYIDVNNYKKQLLNMKAFDQIIRAPEMNIIWADILNKDKKMGEFNLWQDPSMSFEDQIVQRADAEYALAQLLIDQNIPKHLQLKYEKDGIYYDGNDQISKYNEGDYVNPEEEGDDKPSNDEERNIANVDDFIKTRDPKTLNQSGGLTFEVEGDDVTIYKAKQQTSNGVTIINPQGIALGTVDLGAGPNRAFNEIMKTAFPNIVVGVYDLKEEEILTDTYMENITFKEELTADEYLKKLNKKINKGNKRTTWKEILEGSGIKTRADGKMIVFSMKGSGNNFEWNPMNTTPANQKALRDWIDENVNKVSNEYN